TGDMKLANAVTSTTPGNNCPLPMPRTADARADSRCSTTVPVPRLEIVKKADKTEAKPGDTVTYTVTVPNTGQTDLTGANFVDDLSQVLDDASYNGDARPSGGSVSYAAPKLTWTGDLAIGQTVTVTYSVTVNDPPGGDGKLVNA